ncbi:sugar-phosphatase [Microbacterium sp. W4I4]|uniref:HAD-IA family hydrolase n=1 Tax=Microbacterium sp. W4I4 TaxID=3042295 RepID=UPI00278510A4|nr:sugar-phosphatase [Microbacterium sp. W4I4]
MRPHLGGMRTGRTVRMPPSAVPGAFRWRASEVLFDMDGTLLDSVDAIERAWARWSEELGLVLPDPQLLHGRTAADLVGSLVSPESFAAALARLCRIEEQPEAPLPSVPGAAELLEALPASRWSIVTSATRPVALARLRASGLPMPVHLVTGDDVAHGKPDPEPFLAGRRHAGAAQPAVAFEDSVAGSRIRSCSRMPDCRCPGYTPSGRARRTRGCPGRHSPRDRGGE